MSSLKCQCNLIITPEGRYLLEAEIGFEPMISSI
ncbi:hypothetical protein [Escherichia phage vB-Eco-KMB37]|nr:hypothetical protein [Escherichia phage vB-Eco-KMB37]